MKISFNDFEAKVETISKNTIRANIIAGVFVDFIHQFNQQNGSTMNVNYLFDSDTLRKEDKKMFDKCLEIGTKKTYTEVEQEFINNYFALSLAINVMSPKVKAALKASNAFCNLVNGGIPAITLIYDNYAMGFEDVGKVCIIAEELTPITQKISLSCKPLTQEEIQKFISYLSKNTYDTFNIILWGRNNSNEPKTA